MKEQRSGSCELWDSVPVLPTAMAITSLPEPQVACLQNKRLGGVRALWAFTDLTSSGPVSPEEA
jgi:hypothetical protein